MLPFRVFVDNQPRLKLLAASHRAAWGLLVCTPPNLHGRCQLCVRKTHSLHTVLVNSLHMPVLSFQSLTTIKFSNHFVLITLRIGGGGVPPAPSLQPTLQICTFVFNHFQDAPSATLFFSWFCIVARGWVYPSQSHSPLMAGRWPQIEKIGLHCVNTRPGGGRGGCRRRRRQKPQRLRAGGHWLDAAKP